MSFGFDLVELVKVPIFGVIVDEKDYRFCTVHVNRLPYSHAYMSSGVPPCL